MKEIIGVVHLPLDAYDYDIDKLEEWLIRNLKEYYIGGIKNVMIQDQVIESKASIETIARVSLLCKTARKKFPDLKLGLILDSNDCEAAIKIAEICKLDFVRLKVFVGVMVKNSGLIQGCASENQKLIRSIKNKLDIFVDIYDKTGTPLGNISYADACKAAIKMGAKKLILTGSNIEDTIKIINEVSYSLDNPIYVGGGVSISNISKVYNYANGFIVSSSFLKDGTDNEWSSDKIKDFINEVNKYA